MTGPDPDPDREDRELKARLDKLAGRLSETRQQEAEEKAADDSAMARGQEAGKAMSLAFRMVSEFIGGILVGVGIGWVLDKALGTSPVLLIIFSLLGTAAGFFNVIRAASPPRGSSGGPGKNQPGG